MKNFDHYSGMSPETIHNLSMKIKDLNREYSLIIEFVRGLSSYLKSVDLLNKELGAHERLFQIIDKDEVLNIHLNDDASSGVNDSRVCADILASARPTTSTCPKTAQPAG